jgi:Uma2 family endonuclease
MPKINLIRGNVMVAIIEWPAEHMVLRNISWNAFERILDDIGETHHRVTYQDGDLEFITISLEHDGYVRWIGHLIFFVAFEMELSLKTGGSTTLKKALRKVGLEPDECFWIKHAAQIRGKKKWNALTDPPPDLAVEIDITSSWLDRLEIYAALKVPEVWRFDGETLKVLVLGANGKYKERVKSVAFPSLPMDDFLRFVKKLDSADELILMREFTDWLRSSGVAKKTGGDRKNGRR